MKKILSLIVLGTALIPTINAESVITLNINFIETLKADATVQTSSTSIDAQIGYNETDAYYYIPDFLGYKDTNGQPVEFRFYVDHAKSETVDGVKKQYVFPYEPNLDVTKSKTENTGLYYLWDDGASGGKYNYNKFTLPLQAKPSGNAVFEPWASVEFEVGGYTMKFYNPQFFMTNPTNPNKTVTQNRTWAIINSDGSIDITIQVPAQSWQNYSRFILKNGDTWGNNILNLDYYEFDLAKSFFNLTFTIPTSGLTGIDGICADNVAENAPVEYYTLQGVKVMNPANGLYIRRQGSKVSKIMIR